MLRPAAERGYLATLPVTSASTKEGGPIAFSRCEPNVLRWYATCSTRHCLWTPPLWTMAEKALRVLSVRSVWLLPHVRQHRKVAEPGSGQHAKD
jgi:hypothetical protein